MARQLYINQLTPDRVKMLELYLMPEKTSPRDKDNTHESLRELIENDTNTLDRYGITHTQVGDRLDSLIGKMLRRCEILRREGRNFFASMEAGVQVGQFTIEAQYEGIEICPFTERTTLRQYGTEPCGKSNKSYLIHNKTDGANLQVHGLTPHLIRDHHFFGSSIYLRVEPEDAISTLELEPGVDYTPLKAKEIIWEPGFYTSGTDDIDENLKRFIDSADTVICVSDHVRVYLRDDTDSGVLETPKDYSLDAPIRIRDGMLYPRGTLPGLIEIVPFENEYIMGEDE